MGANIDQKMASKKDGVYTYRLNGGVVHLLGSLHPLADKEKKFAQIYFYEPMEQAEHRNQVFKNSLNTGLL